MKQYDMATLIGLCGVCFQVTPETSAPFQKAFFENGGSWSDSKEIGATEYPYLFIGSDGVFDNVLLYGLTPLSGYEQVILAPEQFNSQKELMKFLVMGGEVYGQGFQSFCLNKDGMLCGDCGLVELFENYKMIKPRIDKPKPKWFPAWVSDIVEEPNRRNLFTLVCKGKKSGIAVTDTRGIDWSYCTPLTDTELAEFGLKRIENEEC